LEFKTKNGKKKLSGETESSNPGEELGKGYPDADSIE